MSAVVINADPAIRDGIIAWLAFGALCAAYSYAACWIRDRKKYGPAISATNAGEAENTPSVKEGR